MKKEPSRKDVAEAAAPKPRPPPPPPAARGSAPRQVVEINEADSHVGHFFDSGGSSTSSSLAASATSGLFVSKNPLGAKQKKPKGKQADTGAAEEMFASGDSSSNPLHGHEDENL